MKLREYDRLFLDIGIADAVSPEIMEIPGADAYLLILSPDRDYVRPKPFLWSMLKTGVFVLLIRIGYIIASKYWASILDLVGKFFNLIF
jgi:hypothetical protein